MDEIEAIVVGRYRMRPYGYKAWQIDRYYPKKKRWDPYKYPGSREQGIEGMISLLLIESGVSIVGGIDESNQVVIDFRALQEEIKKAVQQLDEAIEKLALKKGEGDDGLGD